MPTSSGVIDKIAILLGVLWACFAVLLLVELARHAINDTSDGRSQLARAFSIFMFLVSAASLLLRFAGWRWVVVVPCVLIAIRDYFFLMVPRELYVGFDQIIAAVRLAAVFATIALAAVWGRFAARDANRNVTAT